MPVLLLHRRNCASSDIGHARYLSDQLPDADLVLLPGADELWFVGDTAALLDESSVGSTSDGWFRPPPVDPTNRVVTQG